MTEIWSLYEYECLACSQHLNEWQQQMGTSGFSLTKFLGSDRQQIQWQAEGLPSDQLSAQNAIVVMQVRTQFPRIPSLSESAIVLLTSNPY